MPYILISVLIFFSTLVYSQGEQADGESKEMQQAVDKIFAAWDTKDTPGASLGIFKDGKTIYARGYGMANLEYGIANDTKSVFRIASTSKQFTAACILLLEEQGKLKLSDNLSTYFPEFPDYAKDITLQQLLNHTSGVRDYLTLSYLKGLRDDDFFQDKDVLQWLSNQNELNFKPGDEHLYSNSGYWLLGQIVKQVAGMDMAAFAEQEIFKPLGMKHTHFHNDHNRIVKHRASGYEPIQDSEFKISMTTLDMIGDGGIFTSIEDIKLWDDAFYHSETLSPEFWQAMTQTGVLNSGESIDYASGLALGEYKGLKTISHGGAFVGFRAELLRFPEQKFSVVVFANRVDAQPTSMAYQVANIYLANDFKAEAHKTEESKESSNIAEVETAAKPEATFTPQQIIGNYELRTGLQIEVTQVDAQLHALQLWNNNEYDLTAIETNSNTYQIGADESLRFTFINSSSVGDKEGRPQAMKVLQGGENIWKRVEPVDVSAVNINDFIGNYYSQELQVNYQLSVSAGLIYLQIAENTPVEVRASGIDQLSLLSATAKMYREQGEIKGFILEAGRVNNMKFVKR